MRNRFAVLMGPMAITITFVWLVPVPVAGQVTSSAVTATWTTPRTPDGQPDLQGVWTNVVVTPLERPSALAGREALTVDEVARLEERIAQRQIDRAPREGDPGTYNRFWVPPGKVSTQTSLIVDPPDGRMPPLTPQGQKRADANIESGQGGESRSHLRGTDGPEQRTVWERCLTRVLPRLPGGYNNNFQILQTPEHLVILMEMVHEPRIIPLDGRPHVRPSIRPWLGDSRGRWEGDTLVIETSNFSNKTNFRGSGGGLHLVERLTRVDAETINYEVTIADSTTFTRPWTAAFPLTKTAEQIYEYACHEGNYGMRNLLAGARAEEKVADAARAQKGSR